MNKNAIKKFAIDARNKLIASAAVQAGMLGITADNCSKAVTKGADFEVYQTAAGTEVTLNRKQCAQRRKLAAQIHARGFETVMEEAAYTWFNRICAIRFMEVNDYMYPVRIRVLSSEKEGKHEPDIVTMAPDIGWDFTDQERAYITEAKIQNQLDDLFKLLFIKQCNLLHEVLPGLFEEIEDYMELLLHISFTNKDDVIRMLIDGVDEKDFNVHSLDEDGSPTGQVEIIGWLYQYYNTELKDDTFARLKKKVKISKERIPAATQLFTPDWIVRYMVENSVGRVWIEHLRALDPGVDEKETAEKFGWKYYLPEAGQEEPVHIKLAEIRASYRELKPEDITCIDPCMGSGHILAAMFDVLMDIYESAGYNKRDAAFKIVKYNIHGLDIDKRAYQLAYFAVMMKGRGYNRKFFAGTHGEKPVPNVFATIDSKSIKKHHIAYMGASLPETRKKELEHRIADLLQSLEDGREFGSLLHVEKHDWDELRDFLDDTDAAAQISFETIGIDDTKRELFNLIAAASLLSDKFMVSITNPPYMAVSNGDGKLNHFVKKNYPDSKADLYAVFIERLTQLTKSYGYQAMITQQSWMFLSSFERLRGRLSRYQFINMAHLGARAFEEIGGEVVQTTSFVFRNNLLREYKGTYIRLTGYMSQSEKEKGFLQKNTWYYASQDTIGKIPGMPFAYWISDNVRNVYRKGAPLGELAAPRKGNSTSDNARFLRLWFEVDYNHVNLRSKEITVEDSINRRWYPYNKGGGYRKWYGNNGYLIDWYHDAAAIRAIKSAVIANYQYFMKPGLTWSTVSSINFSIRWFDEGFIFDNGGCCIFELAEKREYIIALLNSSVFTYIFGQLNPTLNFQSGEVSRFPVIYKPKERINELAKENVLISKNDWDSYETSWDFKTHPLLQIMQSEHMPSVSIRELFRRWESICRQRYEKLKHNEEELNKEFIAIYGLEEEVRPEVEDALLSLRQADVKYDMHTLCSYFVGCLFGRYSFTKEGIEYAGGTWKASNDSGWEPNEDNIILIAEDVYVKDDMVETFVSWLSYVFGSEYLEDNLEFISNALGTKGNTAKEKIRSYFLHDFYKLHCNDYSMAGSGKRPIYWLFDAGKENSFKAFIYVHRYQDDTVGRIRTEYLHNMQHAIEQALESAEYTAMSNSGAREKGIAAKKITKYTKQLAEIKIYDEAIAHIANQRIQIDLDDGIKVNYAKFQGVEVAREGKKARTVNLLAKI